MTREEKIALCIFSFFFFLFFLGFYFNENSAGAGGYTGDIIHIWKNQKTFNNFTLREAINFTAINAPEFYQSSKMPLSYILNKFINPFADTLENFRISVFVISSTGPILLFFLLKRLYENVSKISLSLLSIVLYISPYFRTSGFWGLEENYGYIFIIISSWFLIKFLKEENNILNTFYVTLSSSLCVYFDQKLLIIPLICCVKILLSNKIYKIKTLSIFFFLIFALPCFYLIYLWKNVLPVVDASSREIGNLFYHNIAYSVTIIAFYLFPFIFLKQNKSVDSIIIFFKSKINILLTLLFLVYLINFFLINDNIFPILGAGYATKLAKMFFHSNYFYQNIFFIFVALFSVLIILYFLNTNINNTLIIGFFILLSVFLNPIYQEYFDPLIYLMVLIFFKNEFNINFKNSLFMVFYYLILLTTNNIYY